MTSFYVKRSQNVFLMRLVGICVLYWLTNTTDTSLININILSQEKYCSYLGDANFQSTVRYHEINGQKIVLEVKHGYMFSL